ncbi:MAG: uracil-DNA glycosylase [Actinomycetales bacterium]|nr:uracil-DNA glycosylase [Actinomycetales bacterium]
MPPADALPHPVVGGAFASPVAPGTGWPGDPATRHTPVAHDAAEVSRLAAASPDSAALDACISVCRACPRLVEWREDVAVAKRAAFAGEPYWGRPGPGFGDRPPRVLVVGLAPAAHGANRTGRMFTGDRSGDWLYAALHRAGFASSPVSVAAGDGQHLTGVRIIATVRCAPPGNQPTGAERVTCAPWLDRDLQIASETIESILALGGIAWSATLTAARRLGWGVPRPTPKFGHGATATLESPHGLIRLVGSYHVSQQNTFTGRLTEAMLDAVIATV